MKTSRFVSAFVPACLALLAATVAFAAVDAGTRAKAEDGDSDAMIELARAYAEGEGVPKNLVTALGWYRKAADQGNEQAAVQAASMLAAGRGTRPDAASAVRYYLSARYTHPEGMEEVEKLKAADPLLAGKMAATAPPETKALLAKAQAGDAAAQYDLAVLMQKDDCGGLLPDYPEAIRWLKKAAEGGNADAQCEYGNYLQHGSGDTPGDPAKAAFWWAKAAAQKHPWASMQLGQALTTGEGVPKDLVKAYQLLDVAMQGEVEYAEFYRDKIVEDNPEVLPQIVALAPPATQARLKQAEAGDAAAQFDVAMMFERAQGGLPRSADESWRWIERAAYGGSPDAQLQLGTAYFRGSDRVTQSWDEAAKWYRRAADQGEPDAQVLLGDLYESGKGVGQSYNQAAYWWGRAGEQGSASGRARLKMAKDLGRVTAEVKPEPVAEALQRELAAARDVPAGIHGSTRKAFIAQAVGTNTTATYQIALAYLNGKPEDGVPQDRALGEQWMRKAAGLRHPDALAYFERQSAAKAQAEETAARQRARDRLIDDFENEYADATLPPQRMTAVLHFSRAVEKAGLRGKEGFAYALRPIVEASAAHPEELGDYVMNMVGDFDRATVQSMVSPAQWAVVQAAGKKSADDYERRDLAIRQHAAILQRAENGDRDAMYDYAVFCFSDPALRSPEAAVHWLSLAAARGHPKAAESIKQVATAAYQAAFVDIGKQDFAAALPKLKVAAENGVDEAATMIGTIYRDGLGLPEANLTEAVKWYEKGVAAGDSQAMVCLAELYADGRGALARDPAEAYRLAKAAEAKEDDDIYPLIARFHRTGVGGPVDEAQALKDYQYLAASGDPGAKPWLAAMSRATPEFRGVVALTFAGLTAQEDAGRIYDSPREWVEYAAAQGNAIARDWLAHWIEPGYFPQARKDMDAAAALAKAGKGAEAVALWEKVAARGNPRAMVRLGEAFGGGGNGVARDYDRARQWFTRAAEAGYISGRTHLRWLDGEIAFQRGMEAYRKQDFAAALTAWQHSKSLGHPGGAYNIAVMYAKGEGPQVSLRETVTAFEDADALGADVKPKQLADLRKDADAEDLLLKGRAELKAGRLAEARADFEKAVAAGNLDALVDLGELYEKGIGVAVDQARARDLYEKSAKAGNTDGEYRLGMMKARDSEAAVRADAQQMAEARAIADGARPSAAELQRQAEAGVPAAQLAYAHQLRQQHDAKALDWYIKASTNPKVDEATQRQADLQIEIIIGPLRAEAARGNPEKQEFLAEILQKRGAHGEASQWYNKVLTNDHSSPALRQLATDGLNAIDGGKSAAAAKQSAADRLYWTFDMLRTANLSAAEAGKALILAAKEAESGSPEIRFRLADVIYHGYLGVPKDEARARALLVSSANDGFALAKVSYATMLIDGRLGFAKDEAKGRQMVAELVSGAESLPADARHQVAMILFQGAYGVTADQPRALRLLETNANERYPLSCFEYGRALLTGLGPLLAADPVRGVGYLKIVADKGLPQAMALLGQVYEQGVGPVAADPAIALEWYESAGQAGLTDAKAAADRVRAKIPVAK